MRRKAFTLFFLPVVSCLLPGQQRSVSLYPPVEAVITSPPGQLATNTNGVYNVQQWCTTRGKLDDTCFSNAIADIAENGPAQNETHRVGVLEVPVGDYVLSNTVIIPNGLNLAIMGTGDIQGNIWGARIFPASVDMTMFLVQSDSVAIRYLSFAPGSARRATAIQLGDATHYCSTCLIQHDWFTTSIGVHVVNAFGVDFSYSTFDDGTTFGILSDSTNGDIQAVGLTGFGVGFWSVESAGIYINGSSAQSSKYSGYSFQNIAIGGERSPEGAGVILRSVHNASFSGSSLENHSDDFQLYYSTGINIGTFTSVNAGRRFVDIESCTNVVIHDSLIENPGASSPGTYPAIYATNSTGLNVHDNQSFTQSGARTSASYGLASYGNAGMIVHGNSFNSQLVSAYKFRDTSASYAIEGDLSASGVVTAAGVVLSGTAPGTMPVCPNGAGGTLTTTGCAASIARGTITLSAASADTIPLQGVTSSSACTFSPINPLAAWPGVQPYYSVGSNTFTINHASDVAAGAAYSVICALN